MGSVDSLIIHGRGAVEGVDVADFDVMSRSRSTRHRR